MGTVQGDMTARRRRDTNGWLPGATLRTAVASNHLDMRSIVTAAAVCLCLSTSAVAQSQGEYRVTRATPPPRMEGVRDEAAWAQLQPMPTVPWVSYNPNRGDSMPDVYTTNVR